MKTTILRFAANLLKANIALALFTTMAWAQAAKDKESDRVDLKKLEDKYWAAKDDDFSVVQNRAYPKAGRFYGSLLYGMAINDGFENGRHTNLALGWYLNERWGFEFNYNKAAMSYNGTTSLFFDTYGAVPDHNRLEGGKTLYAIFVPFYAKMSFMDKKIVYFDIAVAGGLGLTDYSIIKENGNETKSAPHIALNITQHLFLNERFALRLDFTNKFTTETQARFRVPNQDLGSKSFTDTSLVFGVTIFGK